MEIYTPNDTEQDDGPTEMTIEEFDSYKASCLHLIEQAKAAAKLAQDPSFQKIIMEDYFSNEPKRLGCLIASGRMPPAAVDGAISDLKSIGHLRTYLQNFIEKGNIAAGELENLEIARAESVAS